MLTDQQKQTPVSGVAPMKRKEFEGKENQPCGKKPHSETNILAQMIDVSSITRGEKLSDLHMSYAQKLLKQQFPHINGLQSTVFQTKMTTIDREKSTHKMQIIHTRGNHWILASNIGCEEGRVNVYDSVYKSVDEQTERIITTMFHPSTICVVDSQKQDGGVDCGVFAIATATSLAHGVHLATFDQSAMRKHLLDSFTLGVLTVFPRM